MSRRNCWVAVRTGIPAAISGNSLPPAALLERCHGLSDPAYRAIGGGLSDDPYAAMLGYLGMTLAYLGYIDQARSRLNEALSEARRLRHAHTLALVLAVGDWDRVGSPARLSATARRGTSGLIDRARLSIIFRLRNGVPGTVVDRAGTSAGRPRAAYTGIGGDCVLPGLSRITPTCLMGSPRPTPCSDSRLKD